MTIAPTLPAIARGPADKVACRRAALDRRAAVSRENHALFDTIVPALAAEIVVGRRPVVALYAATGDEAPTDAIAAHLARDGHALALPVIGARDAPLTFRTWQLGSPLQSGPFGIRQPADGDIVDPDVLFVPLVAFDKAGGRLGYGGGFYDRTLARLRAQKPVVAIGLAFAVQEVEALPIEAHDVPLDAVLTERGLAVDRLAR